MHTYRSKWIFLSSWKICKVLLQGLHILVIKEWCWVNIYVIVEVVQVVHQHHRNHVWAVVELPFTVKLKTALHAMARKSLCRDTFLEIEDLNRELLAIAI